MEKKKKIPQKTGIAIAFIASAGSTIAVASARTHDPHKSKVFLMLAVGLIAIAASLLINATRKNRSGK